MLWYSMKTKASYLGDQQTTLGSSHSWVQSTMKTGFGRGFDLALSRISLSMARKMIDWSGLEFRLSFLGPGIEVNEVFHNPVQIVNGNGKGGTTGIRVNGAGPPRCRHDDSKESMWSHDVQPTPVHSLCILVGVWPHHNGPPL